MVKSSETAVEMVLAMIDKEIFDSKTEKPIIFPSPCPLWSHDNVHLCPNKLQFSEKLSSIVVF